MKESLCTQCGMKCIPSTPGKRVQTPLHGGLPIIALDGNIEDCGLRERGNYEEGQVVTSQEFRDKRRDGEFGKSFIDTGGNPWRK